MKTVSPYQIDPAATTGWNTREHSWDLMAGITQQIAPRVSVEVAFNHRSWGNLTTVINRALTPADFNPFIVNVPNDPKLPGGGGYPLTFYEISPAKFNQFDNLFTLADNAGGTTNSYKGVDFNVNARFKEVVIQGGFSTGNVIEDDCGVVHQHPETFISAYLGGGTLDAFYNFLPVGVPGQWPQSFCHRESGWQTNVKALATYNVPKLDLLLSGTVHSQAFAGSNFPAVSSQSLSGLQGLLFFQTNLGRPFSGALPFQFFNIVEPGNDVRRSDNGGRFPGRKEPEVRADPHVDCARHLQPGQLQRDGRLSAELRRHHSKPQLSQPAVNHAGAPLQDQRAVRLLRKGR